MRRIILIGYMGSGKTTVGKALSKETGMMFYDLDWYIESRMRKTRWQSLRMSSSVVAVVRRASLTIWTI